MEGGGKNEGKTKAVCKEKKILGFLRGEKMDGRTARLVWMDMCRCDVM